MVSGLMTIPVNVPSNTPFWIINGLWIKYHKLNQGAIVQQHTHEWPHVTMVVSGSVIVWKYINDKCVGPEYYAAPIPFNIPANEPHEFMALEDNTVICCIHNIGQESE